MAQQDEPITFANLPGDAQEAIEAQASEDTALLPPVPSVVQPTVFTGGRTLNETAPPPPAPIASSSTPAPPPPSLPIPPAVVLTTATRTYSYHYYSPSTAPSRTRDLPDTYFAPTASELQTAFAGQVRAREAIVDRPLLTKKLRDEAGEKRKAGLRERWPETKIRIRFGDRSLLEGTFKSGELIGAVYDFVKCALEEKRKGENFVLYQTPPKRDFKRLDPALKGKTLLELELSPSSVFYIRFDTDALNSSSTPPLNPLLISSLSELPLPPAFDPTADQAAAAPAKKTTVGQTLGFGGEAGKVMPSWMKLGKSGKK